VCPSKGRYAERPETDVEYPMLILMLATWCSEPLDCRGGLRTPEDAPARKQQTEFVKGRCFDRGNEIAYPSIKSRILTKDEAQVPSNRLPVRGEAFKTNILMIRIIADLRSILVFPT
jgi:hypothetical protein